MTTKMRNMGAANYYELVESISCAGLLQPIVIVDGKIVDGRHRYKACLEAGVEPRLVDWSGNSREDLVRLVTTNNLTRRHETDTQRAITTAKLAMMGLGTRSELAATMKVKERVLNRAFRICQRRSKTRPADVAAAEARKPSSKGAFLLC